MLMNKKGQVGPIIGGALAALGSVASKAVDIAKEIAKFVWEVFKFIFDNIVRAAPAPIKIIFFIILFTLFGSLAYQNTVGLMKVCDSQGNLWEARDVTSAVMYNFFRDDTKSADMSVFMQEMSYINATGGYTIGPCEFSPPLSTKHTVVWGVISVFTSGLDSIFGHPNYLPMYLSANPLDDTLVITDRRVWIYNIGYSAEYGIHTGCYEKCVCPPDWPAGESCIRSVVDNTMPIYLGGFSFGALFTGTANTNYLCIGDAYFNENTSGTLCDFARSLTGPYEKIGDTLPGNVFRDDAAQACIPPKGYFFRGSDGMFVSKSDGTTLDPLEYEVNKYRQNIAEQNDYTLQKFFKPTEGDYSNKRQLISFKCDASEKNYEKEDLYVYGLPVFDLRFIGVIIFAMIVLAIIGWTRKR
jgi:hypothetical protein